MARNLEYGLNRRDIRWFLSVWMYNINTRAGEKPEAKFSTLLPILNWGHYTTKAEFAEEGGQT